jgi:predicted nucleic acid-binding protein
LPEKRGVDPGSAMLVLDRLEGIVQSVDAELYEGQQQQALQRIAARDADDWPVLACAMTLNCPVWTEDADFFGSGVATWTSDRIALYFS